MKIALTNIIVNAIDAMTTGKGQLTLITKSIESRYVVMINDNGCGISKENLKNIFKPYYTNKPSGLGIGLAATANILRSNNIRVNVNRRETKGTCFILLFDRTNDSKKINQKEEGSCACDAAIVAIG
jgi:C4-dicarboxylate-specific signal transduction histidine kinase